ncbi:MAG: cyclic nucleotide-binding domain-containing protein [Deltaproteobacteria bacterium]|nr:cyclic nucleotide-binding domain-containing protein [Deltaproteobacteria bacterium]
MFREIEFEFDESQGSFVPTSKVINYIKNYIISGNIEEAVSAYQSCKEDIGEMIFNEFKTSSKVTLRAVGEMFKQARDYNMAIKCFTVTQNFEEVAKLYEKNYEFEKAAQMYEKLNLLENAANNYEKAKQYEKAIELYRKIGNTEKVLLCEKTIGKFTDATEWAIDNSMSSDVIEILRKVPPADEKFSEARIKLANILIQKGNSAMALKFLIEGCKLSGISQKSLEMFYKAGVLATELNYKEHAIKLFRIIQSVSPDYRDVQDRLAFIEGGVKLPELSQFVDEECGYTSVMRDADKIHKIPLFDMLSMNELKMVYSMCSEKTYKPTDILIKSGVIPEGLFIIREGIVDVMVGNSIVASLKDGDYIGEMSMILNEPPTASCIAHSIVKVYVINRNKFMDMLESDVQFSSKIFKMFALELSKRLSKTNKMLNDK